MIINFFEHHHCFEGRILKLVAIIINSCSLNLQGRLLVSLICKLKKLPCKIFFKQLKRLKILIPPFLDSKNPLLISDRLPIRAQNLIKKQTLFTYTSSKQRSEREKKKITRKKRIYHHPSSVEKLTKAHPIIESKKKKIQTPQISSSIYLYNLKISQDAYDKQHGVRNLEDYVRDHEENSHSKFRGSSFIKHERKIQRNVMVMALVERNGSMA